MTENLLYKEELKGSRKSRETEAINNFFKQALNSIKNLSRKEQCEVLTDLLIRDGIADVIKLPGNND